MTKNNKFNIIFLDFDGVLNNDIFLDRQRRTMITSGLSPRDSKVWNIDFKDESIVDRYWANHMDYDKIKLLMELEGKIDNLAIVLSTSWRNANTCYEWSKQFNNIIGWNIPIIGKTSIDIDYQLIAKDVYEIETIEGFIKDGDVRGREIQCSIIVNADSIENYVILDDYIGDMLVCQSNNIIECNAEIGLTKENINKAIKILRGE